MNSLAGRAVGFDQDSVVSEAKSHGYYGYMSMIGKTSFRSAKPVACGVQQNVNGTMNCQGPCKKCEGRFWCVICNQSGTISSGMHHRLQSHMCVRDGARLMQLPRTTAAQARDNPLPSLGSSTDRQPDAGRRGTGEGEGEGGVLGPAQVVQIVADVTQLRAQVGAPGRLIDVAQRSCVLPRGRLGGVLPACPLALSLLTQIEITE